MVIGKQICGRRHHPPFFPFSIRNLQSIPPLTLHRVSSALQEKDKTDRPGSEGIKITSEIMIKNTRSSP